MSAATPTPRRETVYVSVAETAKLVRAALKAAFPGITFSVRSKSYSMGASISVRWTDGPTEKDVERITGEYRGATFDGMIDLKSYVTREVNGQKVHYGGVSPNRRKICHAHGQRRVPWSERCRPVRG